MHRAQCARLHGTEVQTASSMAVSDPKTSTVEPAHCRCLFVLLLFLTSFQNLKTRTFHLKVWISSSSRKFHLAAVGLHSYVAESAGGAKCLLPQTDAHLLPHDRSIPNKRILFSRKIMALELGIIDGLQAEIFPLGNWKYAYRRNLRSPRHYY